MHSYWNWNVWIEGEPHNRRLFETRREAIQFARRLVRALHGKRVFCSLPADDDCMEVFRDGFIGVA